MYYKKISSLEEVGVVIASKSMYILTCKDGQYSIILRVGWLTQMREWRSNFSKGKIELYEISQSLWASSISKEDLISLGIDQMLAAYDDGQLTGDPGFVTFAKLTIKDRKPLWVGVITNNIQTPPMLELHLAAAWHVKKKENLSEDLYQLADKIFSE
jgi:hypothetical protein